MLSATELLGLYRRRELSPVEATGAVLAQIDARDATINAYCLVRDDEAMAAARASERRWQAGEPEGRLDGVPALGQGPPADQRLADAAGLEDDQGRRAVDRRRPGGGPAARAPGRPAGQDDHARVWLEGRDRQPAHRGDPQPVGSRPDDGRIQRRRAAAVASGLGPLSVGTDGGGSIRIPASFCGIVGLKPTHGRVPVYPPSTFGTLSHVGPMTRTVADAALLLDVLSAPDDRDPLALDRPAPVAAEGVPAQVSGLRVAYSPVLGYAQVDPEVAEAVGGAVTALEAAGAQVTLADPGFADPIAAFRVLWYAGAAQLVEDVPPGRRALIDPGLAEVAAAGRRYSAVDYLQALRGVPSSASPWAPSTRPTTCW